MLNCVKSDLLWISLIWKKHKYPKCVILFSYRLQFDVIVLFMPASELVKNWHLYFISPGLIWRTGFLYHLWSAQCCSIYIKLKTVIKPVSCILNRIFYCLSLLSVNIIIWDFLHVFKGWKTLMDDILFEIMTLVWSLSWPSILFTCVSFSLL